MATVDKREQSVSHFFQEIGDDVQHCGADKRAVNGGKGEKNTPVSKETKLKKPKKYGHTRLFHFSSHCHVLLKTSCNHKTTYFGITESCLSTYHSVQKDFI